MFAGVGFAQEENTSNKQKPIIKVFTLQNRDASKINKTLIELFSADDESSLLKFGEDTRTNSIIVTGLQEDVEVVFNLIKRLDKQPGQKKISVIRLNNAPAHDVDVAINNWLEQKSKVSGNDQQINVVADVSSNSLIVSGSQTKEGFEKLFQMIAELDKRPDMVKVKVLITKNVDGKTKVVSKPQILTLEGREGKISIASGNEVLNVHITPYIVKGENQ